MWDCCCNQYDEQGGAEDCCPDWCENRRVRGRFGLAFVAETPCCCPEPIGWQVEFCDTPSKVEQRCKEMVQWANCPPLPRCEPCPPFEVCSPCFPPRCNPCCPLTNPCPPSCPPRCRPAPRRPQRPASPRRNRPKNNCTCCSPPKDHYYPSRKDVCRCCPKKCCCTKQKTKSKYCKCDMDEDEEEDDSCPCTKSSDGKSKKKPKERSPKDKELDDDRGDTAEKDKDRMSQKSSFLDDEVPVKESKEAKSPPPPVSVTTTTETKTYSVNTPRPYRTSNQRTVSPPRQGRHTTVEHTISNQNLSTSPQGGRHTNVESSTIRADDYTPDYDTISLVPPDNDTENVVNYTNYHSPNIVNSHDSNISKNLSHQKSLTSEDEQSSPTRSRQSVPDDNSTNTRQNHQTNLVGGCYPNCVDAMGNHGENTVAFAQYHQSMNFHLEQFPKIEDINSNDLAKLYGTAAKDRSNYSFDNFDATKSFISASHTISKKTKGSIDSKLIPGRRTSSSSERLSGSIKVSSTTHPRQSQLGKFTTVYSNMETHETEEVMIVKRRKWLPYELIKNVKRRIFGLFKGSSLSDNENDTESSCSGNVSSDRRNKKVVSRNKDIKKC